MNIFISGTNTGVGKTIISAWLAIQLNAFYFKPIQTGNPTDTEIIKSLSDVKIYQEIFKYENPLSPHIAARIENNPINISKIISFFNSSILSSVSKHTIIEGAGGLLTPINEELFMIDLIDKLNIPMILVTTNELGAINQTLLSLEALRFRNINILGVIINNISNNNINNRDSIEFYGKINILAEFPYLQSINKLELEKILLTNNTNKIFTAYYK
ncbi:dethiobiotin synthase [Lyticum sinuosum]|uniref:ATP-dependent dethiobiotin synthetase BioD n=1 Tax=Lyticum sinuosum TaxID=1332059 RepID=A0AAE4VKY4_9RICK|nr:dethiobiotin synthase [Lyticum sinuosum]MDZ5760942.1 ATP-dependent dethiobiotin synthetase BioD [Lyticum sinuosum]